MLLAGDGFAQELQTITLPAPQLHGGKTVMEALSERKTTREFSDQKLPSQLLSNLLWAAFGQNREKADRPGTGRTAPSGMNRQSVQVYVLIPKGVYVYVSQPHSLKPVAAAGSAAVESGFIGQNVYLFAAAFGLNAWFRAGGVGELAAPLRLTEKQRALYSQSVGYPVRK